SCDCCVDLLLSSVLPLFSLMRRCPSCSTLFPYTTLFRSSLSSAQVDAIRHPSVTAAIENSIRTAAPPFTVSPEQLHHRLPRRNRSEEHTSDSSHVAISYAVFCLKKKKKQNTTLSISTQKD